ncbi:alpha/beta-type small acid-soluble spore protein [Paenibacillus sp. NPDC058174]|uniref:alpha/beta-type small acid-soluble spore protein n=1 Tax=Paenibacillus sp. NPDC058174 TaxID=3346366 RepID=UPI0036DC7031
MARRNRRLLVPEARQAMQSFKADVMRQEGYAVDPNHPDGVKYEVASELGIPLKAGDNGDLKTEDAGQIGGKIGGAMVREMIRLAQEKLTRQ